MARIIVLSDMTKDIKELKSRSKIWGETYNNFRIYFINVIHPDGTEEEHEYSKLELVKHSDIAPWEPRGQLNFATRTKVVTKIINTLDEKYSAADSQIGMYISNKINKLVLTKK